MTDARAFSLARPFVAMTDPNETLKSFVTKPSIQSLQRTSRHMRESDPADFKIQIEDVVDPDPPLDSASDSGIFNASKSTSHSSNTFHDDTMDTDDTDLADQEDQERVGFYDYYPESRNRATERNPTGNFSFTSFPAEVAKLEIPRQRVIDIENESTSDSTNSDSFQCKKEADIIKHFRTDADNLETFDEESATEMQELKNFKKKKDNEKIYDEAINVEYDEDTGMSSLHEKLCSVIHGKPKRYTSMIKEEIEEYADSGKYSSRTTEPLLSGRNDRFSQGTITRHSNADHGKITVHDPRGYAAVDSVVDFKLKTDCDGSLFPSASFSKPSLEEGGGRYHTCDPPFGKGVSIKKVGEAIGRTLPKSVGRGHNFSSMPAGTPIDPESARENEKHLSDSESSLKRRKKKKKIKGERSEVAIAINKNDTPFILKENLVFSV